MKPPEDFEEEQPDCSVPQTSSTSNYAGSSKEQALNKVLNNQTTILQQIGLAQHHITTLKQRISISAEPELLGETLESMTCVLEELHTMQEELQQQNQELLEVREALEAERQRYQELFELAPDGYLVTDLAGVIHDANQAASTLLRVSSPFLVGKPLSVFISRPDQKAFRHQLCRLIETNQQQCWEMRIAPRDQEPCDVAVTAAPAHNKEGQLVGWRWMLRDISEQKSTTLKLQKYANLFEHARLGLAIDGSDGVTLEIVNPAYAAMHGYEAAELANQPIELVFPLEEQARLASYFEQVDRLGHQTLELYHQHRDGRVFPVALDVTSVKDAAGQLLYRIVGIQDITDIQCMREALQQSEQKFRAVFERSAIGIGLTDFDGHILESNPALQQLFGYSKAELMQMRVSDYTHPEDWTTDAALYQELIAGRLDWYQLEKRYFRKDGHTVWGRLTVSLIRDEDNQPHYAFGMVEDITDRKQAEEALRSSERLYRTLIQNFPNGAVVLFNHELRHLLVDGEAFGMLGVTKEQVEGRLLQDSLPELYEVLAPPYRSALAGVSSSFELSHANRTYLVNTLPVRNQDGEIFAGMGVAQDISDRKQLEEVLQRTNAELGTTVEVRTTELRSAISRLNLEIAKRQQTKRALRESEAKYQSVVAALQEGILLYGADGTIQTCNVSAEQILETPAELLIGQTFFAPNPQLIQEDGSPFAIEDYPVLITLLSGRPCSNIVMGINKPQGNIIWLSINSQPLVYNNAAPYAVVVSFTDITSRKQFEEELQRQNLRSRLFAETSLKIRQSLQLEEVLQTTVTEVRELLQADRVILYQIFSDGTGQVVNEAIVPGWSSLISQKFEAETIPADYYRLYRQGRVGKIEDTHTSHLSPCCIELLDRLEVRAKLVVPILQQNNLWGLIIAHQCGHPRQWIDFEVDLLEQLAGQVSIALSQSQLIEALQESEARFRSMADSAPMLLWVSDETKQCTFVNQSWRNFTGRTLEQETGEGWLEGVHLADRQKLMETYEAAFETRAVFSMEYRLRRSDGEYRWMLDKGLPRFTPEGRFEGYIGSVMDISDRRQAEAEMKKALARERELRELKSRFVSMASHEFRTPLSTILSSADLLEFYIGNASNPRQLEHIQRIQNAAVNMSQLLNDVLVLERAEAGQLNFAPAPLNLWAFCRTLVEDFQLSDQAQHAIALNIQTYPALPSQNEEILAEMDEKLLHRIFDNLLSNALKYSPAGSTVSFDLLCEEGWAWFEVKDQGIGIPHADQIHLFEPFHRAENVGTISGTGLGLSIVKQAVDIHQGRIAIASEVGLGTTVRVGLPLHPV